MRTLSPDQDADALRLRRRRSGVLLVALALAATLAVPAVLGGERALLAALQLPARGYLALLAMVAASWIARTIKLRMLLQRLDVRLGFAHVFAISLATDFGFLATPAGLGGYAASVYYARRAGASTSAAAALTAADQGLDLLFFALALPLAGFAWFGSDLPPALVTAALGTTALLGGLALGAVLARHRLRAWFTARLDGTRWPKWQAIVALCARLRAQLHMLAAAGPRFLLGLMIWTTLQWTTRYGLLWLVLATLGHPVSLPLVIALQALVLHVAQWSGVPAGGGGAELGLSAALAAWVPATTLATALLLWRMATLYLGLAAGALAIAWLARRAEPANDTPPPDEDETLGTASEALEATPP